MSIPRALLIGLIIHFMVMIAFASQRVVVYGDNSYPPYSFLDKESKKPMGIYVNILTKAFSKMPEYTVEIQMVPWKRGIKKVKEGSGVALFPPYYAEKRVPWMNFSEPILAERVMVYATPKTLQGKSKWPEDFYGLKVGMNAGWNPVSMGGQAFADAIKAGKIILDEAKSNETCLKKMEKGRIDFYINDQLIDIKNFPKIVRSDIEANKNHGYLGFTRKIDHFPFIPDFKEKFDATIKAMKASGEIDGIVQAYMK